jgi:Tol biopolymer transport system component
MHLYIAGMEVITMRKILSILLMIGALAIGIGSGQQKDRTEVDLQAAIRMETVEGDLKGAIEAYKKIAEAGNRAVAAKALIRMGQCYEKLGDAESRKAYERVVREFADQKEAVEQARALLAANGRGRQPETGIIEQQKWVLPAGRTTQMFQTQMRHVSADGRYIPYQTLYSLWLHDLATGEDRKVIAAQTGESLDSPELSPDGKQIAYTRYTRKDGFSYSDYELRVADIDGSRMRVLINNKERWLWPKAWSPDAKRILILMQNTGTGYSLALASVADGSVQVLTEQDDLSNGCFSPDGKYVVTYRGSSTSGGSVKRVPAGLKLIPVDGSGEIPLFESSAVNWAPFWTPDGRKILFLSDRSGTIDLWSIRVSGGRAEAEPELVKREAGSIDADPIGFTRDGLFYYKTSTFQSDIYAAELDPTTGRVISKPARVNQRFVGSIGHLVQWSPDGQFLVYTRISRRELGYAVWKVISIIVRSERTGEEREIFPAPAFHPIEPNHGLQWFPDGRSLLATDLAKRRIVRQIDVQTGQTKMFLDLSGSDKDVYLPTLSHDGKALFYLQSAAGKDRLMRRNMESGEERELYQPTGLELDDLALSPDGRQLAFTLNNYDKNVYSLMIMPAEGGEPRELLRSKLYINDISWTRDGRHVLMARDSESGPPQLWSVSIDGGESQLSGLTLTGGGFDVSVHPDGRRIAFYGSQEPHEEVWVIKNLLSTPKTSR